MKRSISHLTRILAESETRLEAAAIAENDALMQKIAATIESLARAIQARHELTLILHPVTDAGPTQFVESLEISAVDKVIASLGVNAVEQEAIEQNVLSVTEATDLLGPSFETRRVRELCNDKKIHAWKKAEGGKWHLCAKSVVIYLRLGEGHDPRNKKAG